jgi:secondary thiamine-phosphate synthase enzyme
MTELVEVRTGSRTELVEITDQVQEVVGKSGVRDGAAFVYCRHTTAAVTVNENADPTVRRDFLAFLGRLVPHEGDYLHAEGNSDAHIKSMLVGAGETIPVTNGRLDLGTWQGIFFCEFDGPRSRRVQVRVTAG